MVFATWQGKPLNWRNVTRVFEASLKRADLPPLRFHDLRHTAATLLLLGGVHPRVAQLILGRSDISTTLQTYSHVLPGMGKEAADKLQRTLG